MDEFLILADSLFVQQVKSVTHASRFSSRDILIIVTVGLVVGFALVLWVYFRFGKRKEREDKERMGRKIIPSATPATDEGSGERRRVRKRRRRRNHRPRNPSLQQTGGLPPQRPDDEFPKY